MKKLNATIINDTRPNNHYGCEAVVNNLINILNECNFLVLHTQSLFKSYTTDQETLDAINQSDLIIVNGEGSIHHSNKNVKELANLAPYLKSLNKKIILINSTLYMNDDSIYEKIGCYDYLFLRDQYSVNLCLEHKITNVYYIPDLTFYDNLYKVNPIKRKIRTPKVVVGENIVPDTASKLTELANRNSFDRLYIKYNRNNYSGQTMHIAFMRDYDLVITGRFHTVCYCINALIPFIAVASNTNKIENLLEDCFGNTSRLMCSNIIDT